MGERGSHAGSLSELRSVTAGRLRARREEIYEAVIHRALSVAPPSGREAPGYVEALRAAIPAAIEHAFDAIALGEERVGPTPSAIFVQASASARSEVGLEMVMRRYAAGFSTLSDFLHQEVHTLADSGSRGGFPELQRDLTAIFDCLVAEVSETYRREERAAPASSARRRLERINRLLAGEMVDPAPLQYPLEGFHLALVMVGPEPQVKAAGLAAALDRRLLLGENSGERATVWLGGLRSLDPADVEVAAVDLTQMGVRITTGEQGEGLAGWRRTCRQVQAAQLVAERNDEAFVRYRDVALLAAALRDPDLAHFLAQIYLEPLGAEQASLGVTLLAFIERNGNASSAAAALGVTRHTVASRLRTVEERLGRPLGECAAQLETALRLRALDA
jgi:PucR C-terminal helix-turn-helix domain